jgi:hypothetical protein
LTLSRFLFSPAMWYNSHKISWGYRFHPKAEILVNKLAYFCQTAWILTSTLPAGLWEMGILRFAPLPWPTMIHDVDHRYPLQRYTPVWGKLPLPGDTYPWYI